MTPAAVDDASHAAVGGAISASIAAAARRSGWKATELPDVSDRELHLLLTAGAGADRVVAVAIHPAAGVVVCHSIAPRRFGGVATHRVMEYLTRANSGLVEGNFELDLDDGEVRFKTSFHVADPRDDAAVEAAFDRSVAFNLAVFDVYRLGLERCADGAATPLEAVSEAERTLQATDAETG